MSLSQHNKKYASQNALYKKYLKSLKQLNIDNSSPLVPSRQEFNDIVW